jgi:hypothetical protein
MLVSRPSSHCKLYLSHWCSSHEKNASILVSNLNTFNHKNITQGQPLISCIIVSDHVTTLKQSRMARKPCKTFTLPHTRSFLTLFHIGPTATHDNKTRTRGHSLNYPQFNKENPSWQSLNLSLDFSLYFKRHEWGK